MRRFLLRARSSTTLYVVPTLLSMAVATVLGLSSSPDAHSQGQQAGTLHYATSWVGNSFSGRDGWVQNNIASLYVAPDGTVYVNTIWDEGGHEVTAYKDGKIVGHGERTHGDGNAGGIAIAGNGDYLYTGAGIGAVGGNAPNLGNRPDKGQLWYGVTRRPLHNLSSGAAFSSGRGNMMTAMQNSFALVSQTHDQSGNVTGLAATDAHLYVADATDDKILVLDAKTMAKQSEWHVSSPGRLAVDPGDGSVWVISGAGKQWTNSDGPAANGSSGNNGGRRIVHFSADGKPLPGITGLPADAEPVDLHVDAQHRLLIADNGPAQQILVYTKSGNGYQAAAPVGVKGGVYAAPAGQVGPLRFNGLTGVSTDAKGNLYVSMNGRGPDGAATMGSILQSYAPSGDGSWQKENWQVEGMTFADTATADPADPSTVYTQNARYAMDYSRSNGQEARLVGVTYDRFRYPEDPRLQARHPFMTASQALTLNGKHFLVLSDMYASQLSFYRLDDGMIAAPATIISRGHQNTGAPPAQPANGGWIWRDANGDGRFTANEYVTPPAALATDRAGPAGWWVDAKGNAWAAMGPDGLRRYDLQGLDPKGNPIYRYEGGDAVQAFPVPAPFTRVQRVQYDAASDTMYLTGYTAAQPMNSKLWKEAGTVFARYDHWSQGNRTARFTISMPWAPDAKPLVSTIAVSVAGSYLFAVESVTARVHVYDLRSGKEAGTMVPGADVGNVSGWVDEAMGINAIERSNGEYLVFVEEDARGKVMMYRWHP